MKCVLVFNPCNDIVFSSVDEEFSGYIINHAGGLELSGDNHMFGKLDHNLVLQVFSPLVTSHRLLIYKGDGYRTFRLENDLIFVLQEYSGYMFLAGSREKDESELELNRKLAVFHSLLQFLYGPILEELRLHPQSEQDSRWHFLSNILNKWSYLRSQEQTFLIEAIEQLQVNSKMKKHCVSLLEEVGHKMQKAFEDEISHMMLLVNNKQLALYSKSSECLEARNVLMIMLLTQVFQDVKIQKSDSNYSYENTSMKKSSSTFYKSCQEVKIKTSDSSPNISEVSKTENGDTSSNKLYETPPQSPKKRKNKITRSEAVLNKDNSFNSSDNNEEAPECQSEVNDNIGRLKDAMVSSQEYYHRIVFLQTSSGLIAHSLHSIHIMDGVLLIILCQPKHAAMSAALTQALDEIHKIEALQNCNRKIVDTLDIAIKKIIDFCKKIKYKIDKTMIDKAIKDLQQHWENCKSAGLFSCIRNEKKDISNMLENVLNSLGKFLNKLFVQLFLHPGYLMSSVTDIIMHGVIDCQARIRFCLADYKDYLMVKAVRNYTITSYLEKLPGLVHFIYVDRGRDWLVAPSLNIVDKQEEGRFDTSILIKNKIWSMVNFIQEKLQLKILSMNWKDGDFFFSYFLWFEDKMGMQLKIENVPQNLQNFPLPGILSGHFYKQLVNACFPGRGSSVVCHELMCIHIGLVNASYVSSRISQLLNLVFEMSSVQSPIDF